MGVGEKAAVGIEGAEKVPEAPRNQSPNCPPCSHSPTPPVASGAILGPMFSEGIPSPYQPRRGCGSQLTDMPHGPEGLFSTS